jgi:hypothetical protein
MSVWRGITAWWHVVAAVFLLLAPADSAAQTFRHMNGWDPNTLEISCGDFGAPYRPSPRNIRCMDHATLSAFEVFAEMAVEEFRTARFPAPYRFGPLIKSFESDAPAIRLFTDRDATAFASVGGTSSTNCDRNDDFVMRVNETLLTGKPSYFTAFVASHELFHTILTNAPENLKANRHRSSNCYWPGWMEEAMADAAAIGFTRRNFPRAFPIRPGRIMAENMVGLRDYTKPLHHAFPSNSVDDYNTNSFWLHLADFYHSGRFKFLYDYGKVPAPAYGGRKEDWLRWLDKRLESDPKVRTPLYRVYPGFLTHFAGEWAKGGVGEKFGRSRWLTRAFGGCKNVTVSPTEPYKEISVSVEPMAGRCITVRVDGIQPADLVTVKLGALTGDLVLADSLHLGFVDTNDQTRFNCAQAARKHKPPPGLVGCLFEPVTGTISGSDYAPASARMWYASALELGPGSDQRRRTNRNAIENIYILSYVPKEPWLEKLEGKSAETVTIGVGLEWSALSVDGEDTNDGAADGTRSTTRQRSVAAMGINALEAELTVPPSTGWIDDQGMGAIMGGGMWDMIGEARRMGSEMARELDPSGTVQRLLLFTLAEARIEPLGGAPSEERIEVLRSFNVATIEPLPEEATGTFPAMIAGEDRENNLGYFSEKVGDATLTVEENSRGAFRASVSGDVCVVNIAALTAAVMAGAAPAACPRKIHVSGAISKPFAYLYRPLTELVSEETEGEKLYNRYGPPRLMREMFGGAGGGGGGAGSGGGGGGADTGGGGGGIGEAFTACSCECPKLAIPDSRDCRNQCKPQWAMCEIAAETQPDAVPAPKPLTPTIDAQRKWFSRLVGGHGLQPEVEQMLVDDFATMSDETRKYLIRQYRDGVK